MVPDSPVDALGSQAPGLRDLVVEVVRSRHDQAAEAHQVSGSRYGMGFGSQWRDLLDDTHDALIERGLPVAQAGSRRSQGPGRQRLPGLRLARPGRPERGARTSPPARRARMASSRRRRSSRCCGRPT